MNKRKASVFTIIIAIFLIMGGFSLEFVTAYEVDAREMSLSRQVIDRNYRNFNNKLSDITRRIETASFSKSKYFQDIVDNEFLYAREMNEIESELKEVRAFSKTLFNECTKMSILDSDIQSKCDVMQKNQKTVIETYEKIVEIYNDEVKLCNEWLENNLSDQRIKEHVINLNNK